MSILLLDNDCHNLLCIFEDFTAICKSIAESKITSSSLDSPDTPWIPFRRLDSSLSRLRLNFRPRLWLYRGLLACSFTIAMAGSTRAVIINIVAMVQNAHVYIIDLWNCRQEASSLQLRTPVDFLELSEEKASQLPHDFPLPFGRMWDWLLESRRSCNPSLTAWTLLFWKTIGMAAKAQLF